MKKALCMVIDYGFKGKLWQFDVLSLKNRRYVVYAFKAFVDLNNAPSIYLLDKMGFECSGIEYCHSSRDNWPARDRAHYYLENPKHPPKRAFPVENYRGRYLYVPKVDPDSGFPILPLICEWDY